MRTLLLFFLLFTFQFSFSSGYKKVDSIVKNYPKKFKSIDSFAERIESDFSTDIEKTRAAYFWIANNISYDYYSLNNNINHYKDLDYKLGIDYGKQLEDFQYKYATKCLNDKKAVCEGYSLLLKFTLTNLNVECNVISGHGKTTMKDIGKVVFDSNHAWNAVNIDGKWHLIDATWSTGNKESKPGEFKFSDEYFFAKPEHFILNHYPKEIKWQLLEKTVTKNVFFRAPLFYKSYFNSKLKLTKMNGTLISKDKIRISFDNIDETGVYTYWFKKFSNYSKPISFQKINGKYHLVMPFIKGFKDELIIFKNGKACLAFKII